VEAINRFSAGKYGLVIEIAAVEPAMPSAVYRLEIRFDGNQSLEMTVLDD
jgi:hypothetical protein